MSQVVTKQATVMMCGEREIYFETFISTTIWCPLESKIVGQVTWEDQSFQKQENIYIVLYLFEEKLGLDSFSIMFYYFFRKFLNAN